jgi:hypothetical protein
VSGARDAFATPHCETAGLDRATMVPIMRPARSLLMLGCLLAGTAVPAFSTKNMTVAQFDQWLTAEHGKSDAKVAEQIPGIELSERASATNLAQWEAESPGPRTRDALIALADASRFLLPPVAELPQRPAPDSTAQQAMLSMALGYVGKTLPKLPDFSATRETMHFEDTPGLQLIEGSAELEPSSQENSDRYGDHGESPQTPRFLPSEPIHFVAQSEVVVTYRNGLEVPRDVPNAEAVKLQAAEGLSTSGEFGPILSVIVGDATRSDVQWGYWEQDSAMTEAVFRYSVPQDHSHFTVELPQAKQMVTFSSPYHGEIAIDPATGSILRLTLISDPPPPYQQVRIDSTVEYAPVVIGARTYICPVKGVVISKIPVIGEMTDAKHAPHMKTRLNDVSFTNYHVFRADAKILP